MLGMTRRLRITSVVEFYLLVIAFLIPYQPRWVIRPGVTHFHLINVFLFTILLSLLLTGRKRLRWPFAFPACIYLLGSILGMFNSKALGMNIYTIGIDIYLYVWFAVMCVLLSSNRRVEYLVTAWALSLVLVLISEGFFADLGSEKRLEFTFRNPNRAASYLGFSFFLVLHPVLPRILKVVTGIAILMAVSATGSLAGLLMLPIGGVIFAWAWSYIRAGRALRPLQHLGWGVVAVICMCANFYWLEGDPKAAATTLSPRGGPRMDEDVSGRQRIWETGLETFREHPLGIGPASFQWQVTIGSQEDTKGMHSDFVAALVERGFVGLLGFLLLLGAVARMIMKMLHVCARNGDRRRALWAASLAGAFAAYVSYGITHEMLHHETFWLLLALIVSYAGVLERERYAAAVRVVSQQSGFIPVVHLHKRRHGAV